MSAFCCVEVRGGLSNRIFFLCFPVPLSINVRVDILPKVAVSMTGISISPEQERIHISLTVVKEA